MKFELFTVLVFLALSAVAAAPPTFVGTCDVQMLVRDGRDAEGLAIPAQRAELILPCITKTELAKIIEAFGKGNAERKDRALGFKTRQSNQANAYARGRDAGKGMTSQTVDKSPDHSLARPRCESER